MNIAGMNLTDLLGALLGFSLTLMVFSYIWGDNALFRLVNHIFVGVAAGYVAIITINSVILPRLIFPLLSDERSEKLLALIFLVLSALVLTKISPRLARLGNPAMAFLVGVGAAAAVGGAVTGTIFPQVIASINMFDQNNLANIPSILNALLIFLGTVTTLLYFHFGIRRKSDPNVQQVSWMEGLGYVGQAFIAITFGSLFAGVYIAALSALIERFGFMFNFLKELYFTVL